MNEYINLYSSLPLSLTCVEEHHHIEGDGDAPVLEELPRSET